MSTISLKTIGRLPLLCCLILSIYNNNLCNTASMRTRSLSFSAAESGNNIHDSPQQARLLPPNAVEKNDDAGADDDFQNKLNIAAATLSSSAAADFIDDDENDDDSIDDWQRKSSSSKSPSSYVPQVTAATTPAAANTAAGRLDEQQKGCAFPDAWHGEWFQQRVSAPFRISQHAMSEKGECERELTTSSPVGGSLDAASYLHDKSGMQLPQLNKMRQFILRMREGDNAMVCLVVFQQHTNVLQYKEAWCDRTCEAETLCASITPGSQLYTMFRIGADPIACPLDAPYEFTYRAPSQTTTTCADNINNQAARPSSRIDQCTSSGHLKLYYAARCNGEESQRATLKCLAQWRTSTTKLGSSSVGGAGGLAAPQQAERTYFVAEVEHADSLGNTKPASNEDRFRCFSYQTNDASTTITLAQSEGASCHDLLGLSRLDDAHVVHRLKPARYPPGTCQFPSWLIDTPTTYWQTLSATPNDELRYSFPTSRRGGRMHIYNHTRPDRKPLLLTRATCISIISNKKSDAEIKSTPLPYSASSSRDVSVQIVTFVVEGCANGYKCFGFQRHGDQVAQVRQGKLAPTADDACGPIFFAPERELKFENEHDRWQTLLAHDAEPRPCQLEGRYAVPHQHMPAALLSGSARARESLYSCYDAYQVDIGCGGDDTVVRVGKHAESRNNCLPAMMKALGRRHDEARAFTCHGGWSAQLSESKFSSTAFYLYADDEKLPAASAFLQPSKTTTIISEENNNNYAEANKILPPPAAVLLHYVVISDPSSDEKICLIFHRDLRTNNVSLLTAPACLAPEQIDVLVASKRRAALPSAEAGSAVNNGRFGRSGGIIRNDNLILYSTCSAGALARSSASASRIAAPFFDAAANSACCWWTKFLTISVLPVLVLLLTTNHHHYYSYSIYNIFAGNIRNVFISRLATSVCTAEWNNKFFCSERRITPSTAVDNNNNYSSRWLNVEARPTT